MNRPTEGSGRRRGGADVLDMGRHTTLLLLGLLAIVPASAAAKSETVPQAAARVRSAIPAIEAYRVDRGTTSV